MKSCIDDTKFNWGNSFHDLRSHCIHEVATFQARALEAWATESTLFEGRYQDSSMLRSKSVAVLVQWCR
jgi:hypothetical protein